MRPAIIFLDDGGVMNDNALRSTQWRRLVGEFLSLRLGGATEAWGEANHVAFTAQWQRFEDWLEQRAPDEPVDFFSLRAERERWLRDMCDHVGVPAPGGNDCISLAIETEEHVIPRLRTAFPEAPDAIRALHAAGHVLATASGHPSQELVWNLEGMGIRERFAGKLYGPDLVREPKSGPEFYRRIFADAQIAPSEALVVDDAPRAIAWAAAAGARTVHVRRGDAARAEAAALTVSNLRALVELMAH